MKKAVKPAGAPRARALTVSKPELLVDGADREFRQLVHDTLAFAARIQEIRARLGRCIGLSGTQYTVLISIAHLERREGGVGVNLIADHLHLSGAFVTIEVNKLVAGGLVRKRTNPGDRRRVLLNTTPKAISLLNKLATVQRPVNDTLFDCLTVEDFKRLRGIVAGLVDCGDRALGLIDYLAADRARPPTTARKRA
jgi:DNA-binding MarR family transcriptional regulator